MHLDEGRRGLTIFSIAFHAGSHCARASKGQIFLKRSQCIAKRLYHWPTQAVCAGFCKIAPNPVSNKNMLPLWQLRTKPGLMLGPVRTWHRLPPRPCVLRAVERQFSTALFFPASPPHLSHLARLQRVSSGLSSLLHRQGNDRILSQPRPARIPPIGHKTLPMVGRCSSYQICITGSQRSKNLMAPRPAQRPLAMLAVSK